MVAEPLSLLSHRPQTIPRKGGLGDRFRYITGLSGRSYLFTRIDADDLADFASAVVVLARREPRGMRILSATALDANGRPMSDRTWPPIVPRDCLVLVHLLAERTEERHAVVADLSAGGRSHSA